jgi:Flp pilus assembly protein TadG
LARGVFQSFQSCARGQVFILFALAAPFVLLLVSFGIELARVHAAKSRIISVADAAALSAALMADKPVALAVLEKRAAQTVFSHFDRRDTRFTVDMEGQKPPFEVRVTIEQNVPPLFPSSSVFPLNMKVVHTGSAISAKTGPICALALASTTDHRKGITINGKSTVNAPECGVMVNNEDPELALYIEHNQGRLNALFIHAVGGASGIGFWPTPERDRPAVVDPFLNKADWPVPGGCDHTNVQLTSGQHTLSPGVYCGLRIGGSARVEFLSGLYHIKNARFHVGSNAQLHGRGVSFFLTGDRSHLVIKDGVQLDLSPMSYGPLANLLVARRPDDVPREKRPTFAGRGPSRVEGVIYMPNTHLTVAPLLEAGFVPKRLVFVADRLTFRNHNVPLTLVANGEAGYVSTVARITR